jgi:ABC-2 type transport system permease protein
MSAFIAFSLRAFRESMQSWSHALFRLIFLPLVYLLVFGKVMNPLLAGPGYAAVAVPGIVSMLVMNAALGTVGGVLNRGYYFRSMESWLLAPLSLSWLMLAWVAGGVLAGIAAGLVGALLAFLLLNLTPLMPWAALLCLVYGATVFALLGVVCYCLPQTPAKAQEIMSFILLPMMYLGCTFFSYDMLETPWNVAALSLPTTYLSEALRAAYGSVQPALGLRAIAGGGLAALLLLFVTAHFIFIRRFRDFLW